MRFEFATATRIIFGPGSLREAGSLARSFGASALLVTGADASRAESLRQSLRAQGIALVEFSVRGEPKTTDAQAGAALARQHACQLVVSLGGGSAVDAGKAIAALATNDGEITDYLEVIGKAQPLKNAPLPFIAIPTTAGTGTEVTRNAVLASPEHRVKVSLRSPLMLPKAAIIDPELTLDLPPALTASTGLDALTQLIEPYTCNRTNPIVDGLCLEGITRAARSLRRACDHGRDLDAREDMCVASLCGGLALANAGLGAVHGFAAPIGGLFPAPHGAVCAALLPWVMQANWKALTERAPQSPILPRYETIARVLTNNAQATVADGVQWVLELVRHLNVPPLREYGLTPEDFAPLVEKATQASSMKANPIPLTAAELQDVLKAAWQGR